LRRRETGRRTLRYGYRFGPTNFFEEIDPKRALPAVLATSALALASVPGASGCGSDSARQLFGKTLEQVRRSAGRAAPSTQF
jgi:hypothetical protein